MNELIAYSKIPRPGNLPPDSRNDGHSGLGPLARRMWRAGRISPLMGLSEHSRPYTLVGDSILDNLLDLSFFKVEMSAVLGDELPMGGIFSGYWVNNARFSRTRVFTAAEHPVAFDVYNQ